MIVVAGTPTLRTPEGETALEAGDVVCFPVGPAGAHRLDNAGDETVRVALVSNTHKFGIIEYPDSDKIGIWERHDEALDHMIRRSPDLDYWEGSADGYRLEAWKVAATSLLPPPPPLPPVGGSLRAAPRPAPPSKTNATAPWRCPPPPADAPRARGAHQGQRPR